MISPDTLFEICIYMCINTYVYLKLYNQNINLRQWNLQSHKFYCFIKDMCALSLWSIYWTLSMLNFNACRGGGAIFMLLFFHDIFFEFRAKHQNHFLAKQTEFGRIFSSTTFLTRIFSYSILKVNLCTSRRTQLQQTNIDECLFCYFELILVLCIDVLPRCQHFCSHGATFPVHLGWTST